MSVTISNSAPACSSARLTLVLALLLTTLLGCKEDEHDWCVEAQDEQAVRVSGTLAVEYAGTWGQAPDGFQPFAFMDKGGARVQGCAHDSKGALWRFRGVWQVPEGASSARSYMEILDGNNIGTSILLLLCAVLLFAVSSAGKQRMIDRVIALISGALACTSLICFRYFFPVPAVFTGLAAVLALLALVARGGKASPPLQGAP